MRVCQRCISMHMWQATAKAQPAGAAAELHARLRCLYLYVCYLLVHAAHEMLAIHPSTSLLFAEQPPQPSHPSHTTGQDHTTRRTTPHPTAPYQALPRHVLLHPPHPPPRRPPHRGPGPARGGSASFVQSLQRVRVLLPGQPRRAPKPHRRDASAVQGI